MRKDRGARHIRGYEGKPKGAVRKVFEGRMHAALQFVAETPMRRTTCNLACPLYH